MKTDLAQINLIMAWTWILLGFISGMILGMFFHGENWLGVMPVSNAACIGSGTFRFFGLGVVNLLFSLTVRNYLLGGAFIHFASLAFIIGAIAMPLCCLIMAHFPKAHLVFSIPVVSLIAGGILTVLEVIKI